MIGKVTAWKMTEEERQAYIEKNPIKPTPRKKGDTFAMAPDYKWRGGSRREKHEGN
jgi:hypothetical protein